MNIFAITALGITHLTYYYRCRKIFAGLCYFYFVNLLVPDGIVMYGLYSSVPENNIACKTLKRFQVLTEKYVEFRVFWDVAPCSLIGVDRRF
jgi:hypothetical protein